MHVLDNIERDYIETYDVDIWTALRWIAGRSKEVGVDKIRNCWKHPIEQRDLDRQKQKSSQTAIDTAAQFDPCKQERFFKLFK